MSNIGKQPVVIPEGIDINIDGSKVGIKGTLGELNLSLDSRISLAKDSNHLMVSRKSDSKKDKELHGLYRSLIQNMVIGVSKGFQKELTLVGVGYTAEKKGDFLLVNAGYSHPIYLQIPDNITIDVPSTTSIVVKGINKQNVGDIAAKIRQIRKPEPYKGKGIRYVGEYVRKKAGKTAAA